MKLISTTLLSLTIFLFCSSFGILEPQYSGQNCGEIALEHYADLTNSEVDPETAFDLALELLVYCENNQ